MAAASQADRLARLRARRSSRRPWRRVLRRLRDPSFAWEASLTVATVGIGAALVRWDAMVPVTVLVLPMVVANVMLPPRSLRWWAVLALAVGAVAVALTPSMLDGRRVAGLLVTLAVGLVVLTSSFRRSGLGVAGSRSDSMLVDLRDRLTKQGRIPRMPAGWYAEAVTRSAGGSSFAGDFLVANEAADGSRLEIAVVDVSGKGEHAGTRALLLSGAFGGLLGALPAERFLPAANDYLLRQDWEEGFATAVHLSLDTANGDFEIRSAGHPPPVQLSAGSGRWVVHESDGPVLGLMPGAEFRCVSGRLERGDVLLLYTDGLVESRRRDISSGIDKLLGQGERLLSRGFEHGANRLINQLESGDDDRALLLLHRQ